MSKTIIYRALSKTTIYKARRQAREISARDGVAYQQALDIVARAHGHQHWSAFKAAPTDGGTGDLDALLSNAWRRRSSALLFDIDDQGIVATVTSRNRTGLRIGGNPIQTEVLRHAALALFGIDISGPEDEKQADITVDGVRIRVTVNNCRLGTEHRLVVHMPDVVFGTAPLDKLGILQMNRWQGMLMEPDHGLILVLGKTRSGRSTTIDRSVRWANDNGAMAYGFEERYADEAITKSHDRLALLEVHGEGIHDVLEKWISRHPDVRILGGIEQRVVPERGAGVLESLVVNREASARRAGEMAENDMAFAETVMDAVRGIGGTELENALGQAMRPYVDQLIAEVPALLAKSRQITRQLHRA